MNGPSLWAVKRQTLLLRAIAGEAMSGLELCTVPPALAVGSESGSVLLHRRRQTRAMIYTQEAISPPEIRGISRATLSCLAGQ